jgi:MoxR-like ATPase
VAESVEHYIVELCRASRQHPAVELGASPRASLALLRASRSVAALSGRDHVLPDDVKAMAPVVLPHRFILTPDAQMSSQTPADVVADLLTSVPAPVQ